MTTYWTDPQTATAWAERDSQRDLLALPRAIAAEIIATDRPTTLRIVDIGSGPGAFLSCLLDRFPEARGTWTDISPTMEAIAREQLARYSDRIDYHIADMTDLDHLGTNLDVIVTSRAIHHLDSDTLPAFYRAAARHLAPGGWLVNLDHTGRQPPWGTRLRSARKALVPRTHSQLRHHHNYPLPTAEQHLDALAAAGFSDVDVPWRAFMTHLFMARRDT